MIVKRQNILGQKSSATTFSEISFNEESMSDKIKGIHMFNRISTKH